MKNYRVYAIDFDGTLSLGKYPTCGPQNKDMCDVVKKILSIPVKKRNIWLVLWTSRNGKELKDALDWLKEQGIVFDSINSKPNNISLFSDNTRKLSADLYVDDKAITPDNFCILLEEDNLNG